MELVLDEAGHVKLQDGKPLYRHSDGKEIPFDAATTLATINRLNNEAKGHRIKAEEFEAKAKAFDGLDPEAARKALDTVANLDAKKLIDAGEVDRVKAETARAYEDKLTGIQKQIEALTGERDALGNKLTQQTLGNAFAGSSFIRDKITIPPDAVQAIFGQHFKVENDAVVAYRGQDKVYSRERPGEVASFDEAIGILVDGWSGRDTIVKGSGGSGGGARGSGGAGGKSMTRAAFNALPATEQMAAAKSHTITD
ncbi:DUF6651 domain-containing protein [Azospirillum sp. A26]|uniref:DUF6651 domain-containing protein n=1 Tax=Azospirillum sp. A26 TaxID=3160607 RepID=UPI003670D149